ncbi:MAG: MFS transporter, partial [Casimicrobium sp.]
ANRDGAPIDWRGLLLASIGTLCLLNGLVELHSGTAAVATTLLLTALAALVAFVMWERRIGRQQVQKLAEGAPRITAPLMSFDLFRYRQFAVGSIVAFIYGTALFGSTYLLPVFMQRGLDLSASYVGTILLPAGLVLAVTIAVVGRLADKQPTHRLVSIGLALLASSFALMVAVNLGTSLVWLVMWAIIGRVGLGFILPSLNIGSMRGVDTALIPQGSSVINFVRMLGGATGVSLCGIMLEWRLAAHGDSLTSAVTSAARLDAFDDVFVMLAVVCSLAIVAAWQLRVPPGVTGVSR